MATLSTGLGNFRRHIRLWSALYIVKLVLALLLTAPVWIVTGYTLEHSVAGSPLVSDWSVGTLVELAGTREGATVTLLVMLLSFAILSLLVKQFLNGGIYLSFLRGRGLDRGEFFDSAARLFSRHLVITLVMLPIYLLLLFIGQGLSALAPADLFGKFGLGFLAGRGLRLVVIVLFVVVGVVISEALRMHRSARPEAGINEALRGTFDFLRSHGVKLYGYYLLFFVPFVILWVIVEQLALAVTSGLTGMLGVILELLLFQLCSFARTGQSLLYTATVAPVFRAANPDMFGPTQMELSLD
ncbi:hypothetical protein GF420_11720 [candidate division GN15 bacterium]|nr:hypothetical protein [candidate division GN15 bacterium]